MVGLHFPGMVLEVPLMDGTAGTADACLSGWHW